MHRKCELLPRPFVLRSLQLILNVELLNIKGHDLIVHVLALLEQGLKVFVWDKEVTNMNKGFTAMNNQKWCVTPQR
jgi:hypothetical protein